MNRFLAHTEAQCHSEVLKSFYKYIILKEKITISFLQTNSEKSTSQQSLWRQGGTCSLEPGSQAAQANKKGKQHKSAILQGLE